MIALPQANIRGEAASGPVKVEVITAGMTYRTTGAARIFTLHLYFKLEFLDVQQRSNFLYLLDRKYSSLISAVLFGII